MPACTNDRTETVTVAAATAVQGMPSPAAAPAFACTSTGALPLRERFAYWQSLFVASRLRRPSGCRGDSYAGRIVTATLEDRSVYADLKGDPLLCRFGESNVVLLGFVRTGAVDVRYGSDTVTTVVPASGLVVFDCSRPFTTLSDCYGMTYLALPREVVTTALGLDPVPRGAAVRPVVTGAGLGVTLQAHLRWMGAQGPRLSAGATHDVLRVAHALALATLAAIHPHWRACPDGVADALRVAARYQLGMHADDPFLTSARLARTLGCSRAHLYRVFERAGQTVAGELHEIRMQRAHRALCAGRGQSVGDIAWNCGYTDVAAFDKAFRRHYQMTPTDCRQLAGG